MLCECIATVVYSQQLVLGGVLGPLTRGKKVAYSWDMAAALAERIEAVNKTHLSRELGVDRSYLSGVLNGKKHQGISLGLALRLSRVFGVTVEELSRVLDAKGSVSVN